jgi:aerobic-type carbon monoxide dehydrogenase small subunit (CoxS/CutS family)
MIMTAVSLLRRDEQPTEDAIRSELQRNMCRCGTYTRIVRAVQRAAGGAP